MTGEVMPFVPIPKYLGVDIYRPAGRNEQESTLLARLRYVRGDTPDERGRLPYVLDVGMVDLGAEMDWAQWDAVKPTLGRLFSKPHPRRARDAYTQPTVRLATARLVQQLGLDVGGRKRVDIHLFNLDETALVKGLGTMVCWVPLQVANDNS